MEPRITGSRRIEMSQPASQFVLCFESLLRQGRGFSFPCGPRGEVVLDQLSERTRNDYLFARAMVGRDLQAPAVVTMAAAR
jgi:hypothetical protein